MGAYPLTVKATDENFSEEAYLAANPDVAESVKEQISLQSGRQHFEIFGKKEGRCIRLPESVIAEPKKIKLEKIRSLLRTDIPCKENPGKHFICLTEECRLRLNPARTQIISSNPYSSKITTLIEQNPDKLILDCGAGRRDIYYDNVVNLEIMDFDTTDVLASCENLPFKDNVFDIVLSLSVLEHVRNPFRCASEMARVLKPGGNLICSVPFLQPYHGYPHHYYNMTYQGLINLFEDLLKCDKIEIDETCIPIYSITWILREYAKALDDKTREEFLALKIADLMDTAGKYLDKSYVAKLPDIANRELAYATILYAHKE